MWPLVQHNFYSIEKNQRLYNDARRQCCRRFVFTCKTENLPHGNVLSFGMIKKIAELSTMCRSHLISYFGKEKYRFQFRARDAIVKFIIFCSVTARTEKNRASRTIFWACFADLNVKCSFFKDKIVLQVFMMYWSHRGKVWCSTILRWLWDI